MKENILLLQEKIDIIQSKLTCAMGMKETIEFDLQQEQDDATRAQLEENLIEYQNIIIALENFKETMVE
jgi:hypothetical protein